MKMKFDGTIVTLTNNANYGCIIQRWALQHFLEINSYYFNSYYFNSYYFNSYYWHWLNQTKVSPVFWLKLPLRYFYWAWISKKKPYWLYASRPMNQMKYTSKFVEQRIRQEDFRFWDADKYDCYIVGSDQVWRDWTDKEYNLWYYFLNFVKNPKAKRIAYAASFGKDTLAGANLVGKTDKIRRLAEKFDAIGVREDSGVRLVKEAWGLEARQTIDPTLLLKAEDYSILIDTPTCELSNINQIFYYVLDVTPEKLAVIEQVAARRGQPYGGIKTYSVNILPPVEQWLKGFRDAEFIITDSFHGTVFAIINHKPFITFTNEYRGITRIISLLSSLGLTDRMIDENKLNTFDYANYCDIDWNDVETRLKKLRQESGDWLLEQIRK